MINLGLIGCGYWGKNYLRVLNSMNEFNLKWVCTQKSKIEKGILKDSKLTHDYKKILKDNSIDAVIISTPSRTHYEIAKNCLNYKKDALVEKPITLNSNEALKLCEIADKNKLILMTGHIFIYNPGIIELKRKIVNNELEGISYIKSERAGPKKGSENIDCIWNLAPHDISIMNYLLDSTPDKIYCTGDSKIDSANIKLSYPNNIYGEIIVDYTNPLKVRKLNIKADLKNAELNEENGNLELKIYSKKEKETPNLKKISPLENQCLHFYRYIKSRKKPVSSGREGYVNIRILEYAHKSLMQNKILKIEI